MERCFTSDRRASLVWALTLAVVPSQFRLSIRTNLLVITQHHSVSRNTFHTGGVSVATQKHGASSPQPPLSPVLSAQPLSPLSGHAKTKPAIGSSPSTSQRAVGVNVNANETETEPQTPEIQTPVFQTPTTAQAQQTFLLGATATESTVVDLPGAVV